MAFEQAIFVERLREARARAGLTKRALAERIGLSEHAVGKMEKGLNLPSIPSLVALAEALDVSLDTLCGRPTPAKGGEAMEDREAARLAALEQQVAALETALQATEERLTVALVRLQAVLVALVDGWQAEQGLALPANLAARYRQALAQVAPLMGVASAPEASVAAESAEVFAAWLGHHRPPSAGTPATGAPSAAPPPAEEKA